jgi:Flp pilus assembly protein TadD
MLLRWRLSHIHGYVELGLLRQAAAELRAIPPADRRRPEVLPARMALHQAAHQWGPLRTAARAWVQFRPEDPAGWITWAYAARRSLSLAAAERILRRALRQHPGEATIYFNLGCYASRRGDQEAARILVARAVSLEKSFAELAQTDPDLEGLRAVQKS